MTPERSEKKRASRKALWFRFDRVRLTYDITIALGIALNAVLSLAAQKLGLPLYLDTIGTLIAAWMCGSLAAITTALSSGFLCAAFSSMSIYFTIVNICIAIIAARMFKKELLRRKSGVFLFILILSLISGVFGGLIAWSMKSAISANHVYLSIVDAFVDLSGLGSFSALMLTNLALNLADKTVVTAVFMLAIRLLPVSVREETREELEAGDPDSFDPDSQHRRLLAMLAVEAVALVAVCAWISVALYTDNARKKSIETAVGAAHQVVAAIDPQLIDDYLEYGYAAQDYEKVKGILQGIRDNTTYLEYVYVYRILEDGCHVVFDTVPEGEETNEPGELLGFDPSFLPYLPTLLAGGEIEPLESDDTFGWLLTVYQPIYDRDGRCVAYAGVDVSMNELREYVRDFLLRVILIASGFLVFSIAVGERLTGSYHRIINRQYEQIKEAKEEAEFANQAKSLFLANMSHEIRTPINAVLGMDEMILRESSEPMIRSYAADINTAGNTLLSLINDILDSSKIESGKMEIVPAEYELATLLRDLYNMISQRARAKNLALELEVDESLPKSLLGDDVRIRQVITNILTNAVKYTPAGTVWFRVGGKREGDDVVLHVEVEDTGIGIREEDIPKLFEAFQRIEEGRNRNIEGTGLGMNITIQLLSMMNSKLDVESVYGEGSRFSFDLRQRIVDETPVGRFSLYENAAGESYRYEGSFIAPDAQVLVVDDNAMNLKVFRSLLKTTQVQITEAESGREALSLAEGKQFDMVFMDHMMPEMDGVETMHRMRGLAGYDKIPIYILTANAVAGAKEQYLEEGFDGFISKPIVSEKLEQALREALPEELLKPYEAKEKPEQQPGAAPPDDLPAVDGLDWMYAWLHLPERTLLESTVRDFRDVIPVQADKLDRMWTTIQTKPEDAEALAAYRIQVHGMKSAAATIGIVPLAGMAKMLEFAARDGDVAVLERLHGVFLSEWLSYSEKLGSVFPALDSEEDEKKETADADMLHALFGVLGTAMEELDVDTADEVIEKLRSYRCEPEIEALVPSLAVAVAALDEDQAQRVITQMEALLRE